jgi:hypothetical protein
VFETGVAKRQLGHGHARDAGEIGSGEIREKGAVSRWEILENDEGRLRFTGERREDFVQRGRYPWFILRDTGGQMPFASSVPDHEQSHREKTRKPSAHNFDGGPERRDSFHEILPHEENRLNAAHLAGRILEPEVMVIETWAERVSHDLIKAMVLRFSFEGMFPGTGLGEVGARKNARDAVGK